MGEITKMSHSSQISFYSTFIFICDHFSTDLNVFFAFAYACSTAHFKLLCLSIYLRKKKQPDTNQTIERRKKQPAANCRMNGWISTAGGLGNATRSYCCIYVAKLRFCCRNKMRPKINKIVNHYTVFKTGEKWTIITNPFTTTMYHLLATPKFPIHFFPSTPGLQNNNKCHNIELFLNSVHE